MALASVCGFNLQKNYSNGWSTDNMSENDSEFNDLIDNKLAFTLPSNQDVSNLVLSLICSLLNITVLLS